MVKFYPGFVPASIIALDKIPPLEVAFQVQVCVYFGAYEEGNRRSGDIAVFRLVDECFPARVSPPPTEEEDRDRDQVFPMLASKGELAKYKGMQKRQLSLYGYQFDEKIEVTEFSRKNNLLVYRANTMPGSSGSPLYVGGVIWGVHTCQGSYTFGVGLFDEILAFIDKAKQVLRADDDPFVQRL